MSYETFQSRDEEIARSAERRYQRQRADMDCWPGEETHCRDEHDYDDDNFVMPSTLVEAGVTRAEGEAFLTWIDRKPVQVERMQMNLFPEEVA
jgi:hypothetical protein